MNNQYLITEELAQLYNVVPKTIREWARKKKITGKRYGKRWYFPKEEHDRSGNQ